MFRHKAIYHTTENSEKVKHVQLCHSKEQADHITNMNLFYGFTPAYAEDSAEVDEGMFHIGDVSPQVHTGHYISSQSAVAKRHK